MLARGAQAVLREMLLQEWRRISRGRAAAEASDTKEDPAFGKLDGNMECTREGMVTRMEGRGGEGEERRGALAVCRRLRTSRVES